MQQMDTKQRSDTGVSGYADRAVNDMVNFCTLPPIQDHPSILN
jgi:hypothetical protein